MMHGKCMLHRKDGTTFMGVFDRGAPAKIGCLSYGPGHKFEGEMADFIPNGNGKLTFPDGRNWEGSFEIGKMSGEGIMKSAKGRTLRQGIWSNNEFVGKGNKAGVTPAMSRQQSFVKKIAGVTSP